MLADARRGRFDTIVCWKSDRLSRGMYPAAALMEVVEANQINLEAVVDAIDMKTFGLMAAIGKIELDNFRRVVHMSVFRESGINGIYYACGVRLNLVHSRGLSKSLFWRVSHDLAGWTRFSI